MKKKHKKILQKRADYLARRIESAMKTGRLLSYDQAELSALHAVLDETVVELVGTKRYVPIEVARRFLPSRVWQATQAIVAFVAVRVVSMAETRASV